MMHPTTAGLKLKASMVLALSALLVAMGIAAPLVAHGAQADAGDIRVVTPPQRSTFVGHDGEIVGLSFASFGDRLTIRAAATGGQYDAGGNQRVVLHYDIDLINTSRPFRTQEEPSATYGNLVEFDHVLDYDPLPANFVDDITRNVWTFRIVLEQRGSDGVWYVRVTRTFILVKE